MSIEYRHLGDVLATVEIDEGFPDYGTRREPTQITLVSCEECGAAVSGGFGQNRHTQWHVALEDKRGASAAADLPY